MSSFSSPYLSTRLNLYASRLVKFPQLVEFVEYDLERILYDLQEITGIYYEADHNIAPRIESQMASRSLRNTRVAPWARARQISAMARSKLIEENWSRRSRRSTA